MILMDKLPDDVLLAIFDFYIDGVQVSKKAVEEWQTLVHVCRRWRSVVFESPRRLNLQLVCTSKTRARDKLEVWPPLPLLIHGNDYSTPSVDSTVAALERSNRVRQITLEYVTSSQFEKVWPAMRKLFPELTHLQLKAYDSPWPVPVVPDSFMDGSAPRLRYLILENILYPGLPKLLLSATDLVTLQLWNIPHSGYISPETMTTRLSALTSLKTFRLGFQSPRSRPTRESRHPPPSTRIILPALTDLWFEGTSEYMEDLVARIDVPRLNSLDVTFHQLVFDSPQFVQFIDRIPSWKSPDEAHLTFYNRAVRARLPPQTFGHGELNVGVQCKESDGEISYLTQVCTLLLSPLSTVEHLYIHKPKRMRQNWQDDIEITHWLEFFHTFTAVKSLYLSEDLISSIASSLQELVGGRVAEALPTLRNLFLEGLQPSGGVHEGIGEFVAARLLSGHPIVVSGWE